MDKISSQECGLKMAWTAGLTILRSIIQSPADDQEAVVYLREQNEDFTLVMLADDTKCSWSHQSARGQGCQSDKLSDRNPMEVNTKSCIWEVAVKAEVDQLGNSSAVMAPGAVGNTSLAQRSSTARHSTTIFWTALAGT